MSVTRHGQSTQKKVAYLCNISIKAISPLKLSFCLQINSKVFHKRVVSLWEKLARQTQSTKNNQFTIYLQYLNENMKEEVDFLPADKCWTFFQIDAIILGVWLGISKLPKITSLLLLYNMLRMKLVMQLIFSMQISMKTCAKLILRFFDGYGQAFPKFPKTQVCNVFTIPLKKLEMKVTFLMQINIKVS